MTELALLLKYKWIAANLAAIFGLFASMKIADAAGESPMEHYTLEGFLLVCVFFLVRQVMALLASNTKERQERESKMDQLVQSNTDALNKNADSLKSINDSWQGTMKRLIDKAMGDK